MTKTAEFGQPTASAPQPGKCRICGCTKDHACTLLVRGAMVPGHPNGSRPCCWTDHTETLCDNPKCIAAARRELGFAA